MFYLFLFIRFNEFCAALFVLQKMLKETIMHFKANLRTLYRWMLGLSLDLSDRCCLLSHFSE